MATMYGNRLPIGDAVVTIAEYRHPAMALRLDDRRLAEGVAQVLEGTARLGVAMISHSTTLAALVSLNVLGR